MRRQGLGWLAASVALLAAVSCFKDPTSSLHSSATRLQVSRTSATIKVADSSVVTVQALDNQGNYAAFSAPTYATLDANIVDIIPFPDTVIGTVPGNTLWKAELVGKSAGTTRVTVTAAGLTDTISVLVFPTRFTGTVLPAAVHPGDTVTFTAPTNVTFGAAATGNVGSNGFYSKVSSTATQLRMIAGATGTINYSVTGTILLGTFPVDSSSPAGLIPGAPLVVTELHEPANDTAANGTAITLPTVVGDSAVVFAALDSAVDSKDYWTLTPATSDSVQITVDWPNAALNLDAFLLLSSGSGTPGTTWPCVVPSGTGCPMATLGADPEIERVRLTAGTSYRLLVQLTKGGAHVGYHIKIIKRS